MFKLFHKTMRWLGFIPVSKERQLIREIILLERENDNLIKDILETQDENGSLWDMLDEIKKSDISKHKQGKLSLESFMEEIQEAMTDEMMKDFKPVGEA